MTYDFQNPTFVTALGNYSKGWYGNFTGSGRIAYDELKIILKHVCWLGKDTNVPDKDVFTCVADGFDELVKVSDHSNRMYTELWNDSLFPDRWFPQTNDSADVKLLNKMLRIIAQLNVKYFPNGVLPMDPKIALLFSNGQERLDRRAVCEAEWSKCK